MRSLVLFLSFLAYAFITHEESIEIFKLHPMFPDFLTFMETFGLKFSGDEIHHRFAIYLANSIFIESRNKQGLTFTLKMNAFGAMTVGEYGEYVKRSGAMKRERTNKLFRQNEDVIIKNIDYRELGMVSRVKDQGQCGSCWAFSTTGCLESQMLIEKVGKSSLSEQELVDCSTEKGNMGCNGGLMDYAFEYAKSGLTSDSTYPYTAIEGECKSFRNESVVYVDQVHDIPSMDENALSGAVTVHGPVSVAIDASTQDFQFYYSGIFESDKCSSEQLNHALLVVGLGSDPSDYYIVKNSWGELWGDRGYIKIARNKNNMCGIATCASFATIVKQNE